jgi:hypothetical protein
MQESTPRNPAPFSEENTETLTEADRTSIPTHAKDRPSKVGQEIIRGSKTRNIHSSQRISKDDAIVFAASIAVPCTTVAPTQKRENTNEPQKCSVPQSAILHTFNRMALSNEKK